MESGKEALEGMPEELRAKVEACESADELKGVLQGEGFDFSDELLEGIAGGTFPCGWLR